MRLLALLAPSLLAIIVSCRSAGLVAADDPRLGSIDAKAIAAEQKTAKLFGAGGLGLDAFQSGFFISAEGHLLTVWSTVLDLSEITVITSGGRRLKAQLVGVDPNLELAVLKTDKPPPDFFQIADATNAQIGQRVLAVSNLFKIATGDEMCSIQKGQVMTITDLKARRGNFQSVYQGPALIIDAMTNNPGAAGGALIDLEGHLVGILGKELRDTAANIWINYAIPVAQFSGSVNSILQGKVVARTTQTRKGADRPVSLELLGIALIPNVLPKTPAYIDVIEPASRAARAGLQADDLVLLVNTQRVGSQIALKEELQFIDRADPVTLLVQRGSELREVVIRP